MILELFETTEMLKHNLWLKNPISIRRFLENFFNHINVVGRCGIFLSESDWLVRLNRLERCKFSWRGLRGTSIPWDSLLEQFVELTVLHAMFDEELVPRLESAVQIFSQLWYCQSLQKCEVLSKNRIFDGWHLDKDREFLVFIMIKHTWSYYVGQNFNRWVTICLLVTIIFYFPNVFVNLRWPALSLISGFIPLLAFRSEKTHFLRLIFG